MLYFSNTYQRGDDDFVMPERNPIQEGNDPLQKNDNKGNGKN
jgi:hypothetical protein